MSKFLQKFILKGTYKKFEQQMRIVTVTLYSDLNSELNSKFKDSELNSVIAAQVVNYLMGEDLEMVYKKADNGLKLKIDQIKEKILPFTNQKMADDSSTREIIVNTLRVKNILQFSLIGSDYFKNPEKNRIDSILSKYGEEFPKEPNLSDYERMVSKYYQQKFKPIESK